MRQSPHNASTSRVSPFARISSSVQSGAQLREHTRALYADLFEVLRLQGGPEGGICLHALKIWNYLPHITADLDGLEFVARIDVGTDTNGEDKNEIRAAVTPDHKEYAPLAGAAARATAPQLQPAQASMPQPGIRPSWAQ